MGISGRNPSRIAPLKKTACKDPSDIVILLALLAVPSAYYLGLQLDWVAEASATSTLPIFSAYKPPLASPEKTAASAGDPSQDAGENQPQAALGADPDQPAWDEMVKRLQVEAVSYSGRVAIYLKDLKRNKTFFYQADDLFPSASLVKVPIMSAIFEKIKLGELALDAKCTLRRRHRVGGSGSLKWYRDGSQFTVRQLVDHMIDESDNTATKMLIDIVGMNYLQQQFPREGLLYTEIYPEGMSLRGSRVTYENYTTAREMASLLEKIYRGEMVDRESSALMLDVLKHQKHRARLAKGLPPGWEIAHKTGLLRGACHDSAIIFTPNGDYLMVVLTGQNRYYGRAKDFITRLGKITFKYYKGSRSVLDRVVSVSNQRFIAKRAVAVN